MNFLAHIFLSGDREEVIFGNFIADEIKGSNFQLFKPGVIQGIRLHREIDHYTDHHPLFRQSKARLVPKYRIYSGIIVDIYYDHFLARNWREYSNESLAEYTHRAYGILIRRYPLLPGRSKRILPFMIAQNWLVGYSRLPDLRRVFQGMSRRTGNSTGMEHAVDDLEADYALYEAEFRAFFPQLAAHAGNYRSLLSGESPF